MANQATAKKGEEFRFDTEEKRTTKDKIIFERIEQQQKGVLGEKQKVDLTGGTERDVLTGKSNIIDFLKYKEAKKEKERERVDKESSGREQELLKNDWLKEKEKLVKEVVAASGIEDQEEIAEQTFYDEYKKSPTNFKMAFNHLEVLRGFAKMSSEQSEAILNENKKINSRFKGKIPYNELSAKALALDDVAAELKDEKAKKLLSRVQGKKNVFGKTKVSFYRFINGQKRIKSAGGVTQRVGVIRAQSIDKSVDYSMRELLTGNNLGDAMERIYTGMQGRGFATGLPNGVSNGLANVSATAGSFLKKSLGGLGEKLGPGIKKGIGNVATELGVGLGKAATGLGSALSSIGGYKVKAVVAISTGVLIAILAISGAFASQQYFQPTLKGSGWMWDEDAVESSRVYSGGGSGEGRDF